MRVEPRCSNEVLGIRHWIKRTLAVLLVTMLAAMPTASAFAGPTTVRDASSEGGISINVPIAQLGSLASSLPVGDLNMTPSRLDQLLSTLPGLTNLSPLQKGLLQTLISTLPANTTLNGLLEGIASQLGAHITPTQLFNAVAGTAQNPTEIAQVLSSLAGALNSAQLAQLQGVLGALTGSLSSGELGQLQTNLNTLLGGLGAGKLQATLSPLEGILSGTGLTQLQTLLNNLGSLTPAQLQTQLQELLGGLTPTQLSALLSQMFSSLNPAQLQSILGGLLGGLSFTPTTAGQLAQTLGVPLEKLASQVGTTAENLPANLAAVTAPLSNGHLLSLLDGLGGLSVSVLGGGNGPGGSGGQGSSGGNGGPGSPGATTVALSIPLSASTTGQSAAASRARTAKKLAKVRILSHKVKGRIATIIVQVPAAGKLTLSAHGVISVSHRAHKAERIILTVALSKAAAASLHKRHTHLKVKLTATFRPSSGAASSATATVVFT